MILYVCSQGLIRSRTAEVLTLMGGVSARSCGIDSDAYAPITNKLLRAASTIVCMERHHADHVHSMMGSEGKALVTLSIEDVWDPYDAMLVHWLEVMTRAKLDDEGRLSGVIAEGFKLMKHRGIDLTKPGLDSSVL